MSHPLQHLRTKTTLGSADTEWHIDQAPPVSGLATMPNGPWTHALIVFEQVEDDGEGGYTGPLADNDTTADVTIVLWREADNGSTPIGQATTLPSQNLRAIPAVFIPPGWSFTVHVGVVTDPNVDADALRIYWQPIVKPS